MFVYVCVFFIKNGNVPDYNIVVNGFEHQSRYHVHFRENSEHPGMG